MAEPWRPADHLAWLCQAPQLLGNPETFHLHDYLPDDWAAQLARWDAEPASRPAALMEPPNPRLGYYFERLYECVLTQLLGWTLVAKNLQVQESSGRTLGEMDFLLRNPSTGRVEHHEIAVKFYLGYGADGEGTRWFGPNSRDRLDLKVQRLLGHQSHLGERPEARALLAELGVHEPVVPRVFMPGYLFYPAEGGVSVPDFVPAGHLRGHWLYLHEAMERDTRHWVPLHKPHWLGPWRQWQAPDPAVSAETLASVEAQHRPRLFAALEQELPAGGGRSEWRETARTFVVPAGWPSRRHATNPTASGTVAP